ncbi:hypothetical protein Bca4012_025401 [Brassica carinata]
MSPELSHRRFRFVGAPETEKPPSEPPLPFNALSSQPHTNHTQSPNQSKETDQTRAGDARLKEPSPPGDKTDDDEADEAFTSQRQEPASTELRKPPPPKNRNTNYKTTNFTALSTRPLLNSSDRSTTDGV